MRDEYCGKGGKEKKSGPCVCGDRGVGGGEREGGLFIMWRDVGECQEIGFFGEGMREGGRRK